MKTRHYVIILATIALAMPFMLSSCKKDSTSNPASQQVGLKIAAVNNTYAVPVLTSPGATPMIPPPGAAKVVWSTGIMVVSSVKYELLPQGSGSPMETENQWVGPARVDLFDLSSSPLGKITIPRGVYREIEFKVYGNTADAGKDPVLDLSGAYTNTLGKSIPLVLIITDNVSLAAERDNVTVNTNVTDLSPFFKLYLDALFTHILPRNLDQAVLTDGQIVISATSNADIYQIVLGNLALAGGLSLGDN